MSPIGVSSRRWLNQCAHSSEVVRPVVHQAVAAREQIRPRVGRLRRVAHRMGKRRFDHFTGRICLLRRSVPEARPEPMRLRREAEFLDQLRQRHVGERLPAGTAEDQAGAIAQSLHVVQDRKRSPRERERGDPASPSCARRGMVAYALATPRPRRPPPRLACASSLQPLPPLHLNREVVSLFDQGGATSPSRQNTESK